MSFLCRLHPLYLHAFAHIFIYRVTVFKLADGLKIRDIKWKRDGFESTSMVFNTCNKICLQNVEYLYAFRGNTRRKIKEL